MNGPIRRVALLLLVGMAVLVVGATWHQGVVADRYRAHPDNRRIALFQAGKERGLITTVSGTVLAFSEQDPDIPRSYVRKYPAGEAFASVVGTETSSGGLENAFVDELRSRRDLSVSDLMAAFFGEDLRPRRLTVTLDPDLQQRAYEILSGRRGAVAAVRPDTGEVLALVSSRASPVTERAAAVTYPLGSASRSLPPRRRWRRIPPIFRVCSKTAPYGRSPMLRRRSSIPQMPPAQIRHRSACSPLSCCPATWPSPSWPSRWVLRSWRTMP